MSPYDFHPFGSPKDGLLGRCFPDDDDDDDELKHNMFEELRRFVKEFYATDIQRLARRWKKCFETNGGNFVE